MGVNEAASAMRWVKINRKKAVHLYWLLEAYDNLWAFTTLSAKSADKDLGDERVVLIRSTKSQEKEMSEVLHAICKELDAEVLTRDVFLQ